MRARPNYALRRVTALALIAAVVATAVIVIVVRSSGSQRHSGAADAAAATVTAGTTATTGPRAATTSPRTDTTGSRTVITATTSGAAAAKPGSARASASAPSAKGPYRVGRISLKLVEPAGTATPTATSASGAPVRILPAIVRYPATGAPGSGSHPRAAPESEAGRFPLIVFSQGYAMPAEAYAPLLDAWARAGYVVADATYPFTDPTAAGGLRESDIVFHPADLRFTITSLLAVAERPGPLHGLIDPRAVGIAGHSDGGDVTLATAADSCCRDRRVKAAAILSGAELAAFGGAYYRGAGVPMLVVQGSADTINVSGCSAGLYDRAPAPKYYVGLPGEQHTPPYLSPGPLRARVGRIVTDFFDAYLKHNRAAGLRAMRRAATVPGVATITSAPSLAGAGTDCPGAP